MIYLITDNIREYKDFNVINSLRICDINVKNIYIFEIYGKTPYLYNMRHIYEYAYLIKSTQFDSLEYLSSIKNKNFHIKLLYNNEIFDIYRWSEITNVEKKLSSLQEKRDFILSKILNDEGNDKYISFEKKIYNVKK